jgi:hypothetical protein
MYVSQQDCRARAEPATWEEGDAGLAALLLGDEEAVAIVLSRNAAAEAAFFIVGTASF